jgi:hypothetical protein
MNQTIKVIDLLNKIANGEEVPTKIKVNNKIYIYNALEHFYVMMDKGDDLLKLCTIFNSDVFMNMEVEIIEDKEDINIQDIEELPEYIHIGDGGADADVKDEVNIKINEIIRAVKHLEKTKEDK